MQAFCLSSRDENVTTPSRYTLIPISQFGTPALLDTIGLRLVTATSTQHPYEVEKTGAPLATGNLRPSYGERLSDSKEAATV